MLAFRSLGRRIINFADPESQKGFVYLLFLLPSSCYPFPSLMDTVSSSWLENVFLFLFVVSPFIRSSACYPCLSLSVPFPIFSFAASLPSGTASGSRYDGTVKIEQWPKTSIFRFLHREEETGSKWKISADTKRSYK